MVAEDAVDVTLVEIVEELWLITVEFKNGGCIGKGIEYCMSVSI